MHWQELVQGRGENEMPAIVDGSFIERCVIGLLMQNLQGREVFALG